jgi:ribonuclease HII
MKDSKKFHSKSKIIKVAEYIKENAIDWSVTYEDEKTIDEINILQATQLSMHNSILEVRKQYNKNIKEEGTDYSYSLLIDGNYFKPITYLNKRSGKMETIPHITVEGGDNKYCSIAAASILAKVEHDKYIKEMCANFPKLDTYYGLLSNKGYGTSKHIEGIKKYGISKWHRTTYGCCKEATINEDDDETFYKN